MGANNIEEQGVPLMDDRWEGKRVYVIELEDHAEVLASVLRQFCSAGWRTEVLTIPAIHQEICQTIDNPQVKWTIGERKRPSGQLLQERGAMSKADFIVLLTSQRHVKAYAKFAFPSPVLACVHNMNFSLAERPRWYIPKTLRAARKMLFYFVTRGVIFEELWYRRWMYKKKGVFISFLSDSLRLQLDTIAPKGGFALGPQIRAARPQKKFYTRNSSPKRVKTWALPGSVDPKRRDYDTIYSALCHVLVEAPEVEIQLVLLGAATSNVATKIVRRFKALEHRFKQFSLRSFDHRIGQDLFEIIMFETDLILAPVKILTRYKIVREKYGRNKVSGAELDAIKYWTPTVIPGEYKTSGPFDVVFKRYDNTEELEGVLLHEAKGGKDAVAWRKTMVDTVSSGLVDRGALTWTEELEEWIVQVESASGGDRHREAG
jgi:hypothetical protein